MEEPQLVGLSGPKERTGFQLEKTHEHARDGCALIIPDAPLDGSRLWGLGVPGTMDPHQKTHSQRKRGGDSTDRPEENINLGRNGSAPEWRKFQEYPGDRVVTPLRAHDLVWNPLQNHGIPIGWAPSPRPFWDVSLLLMRLFYCDHFVLPLPRGHRFPMEKYALLRDRVVEAGLGGRESLLVPPPATDQQLATVHEPDYLTRVQAGKLSTQEVRRMGFPWSPGLVERSRRSVGGTIAAGRAAMEDGIAVNLSGGTHHAFPDRGEGFCVFNDVAVATRVLAQEGLARRLAILDLDVHQGNGTAAVFAGDPSVYTLSVHGANNFPFRKEVSDLDLELPDSAGDEAFLTAVEHGTRTALSAAEPDLVFFLAGADPYQNDRLGRLMVSKEALVARDRFVFEECRTRGTPVAVVMGGGYAPRIEDTVEIHLNTVRVAGEFQRSWSSP